ALLVAWGALLGGARFASVPVGWPWYAAFLGCAAGLITYVLGGMRLAGAPREAYTALLRAPLYATWKLLLYAGAFLRPRSSLGKQMEWIRTSRTPIAGGTLPPADGASAAVDSP